MNATHQQQMMFKYDLTQHQYVIWDYYLSHDYAYWPSSLLSALKAATSEINWPGIEGKVIADWLKGYRPELENMSEWRIDVSWREIAVMLGVNPDHFYHKGFSGVDGVVMEAESVDKLPENADNSADFQAVYDRNLQQFYGDRKLISFTVSKDRKSIKLVFA